MEENAFAPPYETLPDVLPVFPLLSAFLLPTGYLPLNIFEPRYKQMVEDALAGNRLIGMVQPLAKSQNEPYEKIRSIGCAGKITEFNETQDGRYIIKLTGVYRFGVKQELSSDKPYRVITPDWAPYKDDYKAYRCLNLNRDKLQTLLAEYFTQQEMECNWEAMENVPDGKLITCLSMVCPFEPEERQALLEAPDCKSRAERFLALLEIAIHEKRHFTACH